MGTPSFNFRLERVRSLRESPEEAAREAGAKRVSLAGYADEHPAATNATTRGRALNRRVEIVLTRLHGATLSHGGDTP